MASRILAGVGQCSFAFHSLVDHRQPQTVSCALLCQARDKRSRVRLQCARRPTHDHDPRRYSVRRELSRRRATRSSSLAVNASARSDHLARTWLSHPAVCRRRSVLFRYMRSMVHHHQQNRSSWTKHRPRVRFIESAVSSIPSRPRDVLIGDNAEIILVDEWTHTAGPMLCHPGYGAAMRASDRPSKWRDAVYPRQACAAPFLRSMQRLSDRQLLGYRRLRTAKYRIYQVVKANSSHIHNSWNRNGPPHVRAAHSDARAGRRPNTRFPQLNPGSPLSQESCHR
jgi:hypothetical protein